MKMKHIALLVMALSVMIAGCKKDPDESKDDPNNGTGVCRLKSASRDLTNNVTTFEYDANGRIVKETYSDGEYTTYTNESGKLVIREYSGTGQLKQNYDTRVYTLNSQGYIGKVVDTQPGDTDTYIYTYSPEGHQIKGEVFDYKGKLEYTYLYTIVDGNMVKSEFISTRNNDTSTEVYSFLQAENKAGLGIYPFGDGGLERYYGKVNKNLINTVAISYGSTSLSFNYQMEGDVVKYVKITQPGFPTPMEFWYTYENCK